jgi:hypothetical protein
MRLLLAFKEPEIQLLRQAVGAVQWWFEQAKEKGAWQEELDRLADEVEGLNAALLPADPDLTLEEAHAAIRALEAAAQRCDTEAFKQELGAELAGASREEFLALAAKFGRFLDAWV